MIFEHLLVVKEEVAFAVKDLADGRGVDLMVVAPEPLVPVLPDVGRVVAGLDVADVVDDSEQGVLVLTHGQSVFCKQNGKSC